ncbi:hypothetical protein [Phytomonospora endophytica]|uniref:Transcription initiation factor TFIID subunit TAF12 n=1 Tax=Phytomonospora endophytica TaxID=714109 RepID=A0A841FJM8_9ACTN|nr:hypothetical protein [Phytomonospora endophytica]MBB6036084.1 transcription initiation factor TFIID subunit TAF12 [Phytomonospora endophytica]
MASGPEDSRAAAATGAAMAGRRPALAVVAGRRQRQQQQQQQRQQQRQDPRAPPRNLPRHPTPPG